jgi:hypothetical protein
MFSLPVFQLSGRGKGRTIVSHRYSQMLRLGALIAEFSGFGRCFMRRLTGSTNKIHLTG